MRHPLPSFLPYLLALSLLLGLTACSSWPLRDPLHIQLVNVEPLPGEGLEMRFALTLRVQNPNDSAIEFSGMAFNLRVNQQPLLSGVSDQSGQVPRYGETLLRIPVSLSAYSALRQVMAASNYRAGQSLPYELTGKLATGLLGSVRFSDQGQLDWPSSSAP